jgi:hypothetical protein
MEIAIALGVFTAGMLLSENESPPPFVLPRPTTEPPKVTPQVWNPFDENRFSHIAPLYRGIEPLGYLQENTNMIRLQGDEVRTKQVLDGSTFNADIPLLPRNQITGVCDIDRVKKGLKNTTDSKPFEPEMVSFGSYDRIMPKTVDELRTANNPKTVYEKPRQHGFMSAVGHLESAFAENIYDLTTSGREMFPSGVAEQAEIKQLMPMNREVDNTVNMTPIEERRNNAYSQNPVGNSSNMQNAQIGSFYAINTKHGSLTNQLESQSRQRMDGVEVIGTPQCNLARKEMIESSFVLPSTDLVTRDVVDGQVSMAVKRSANVPKFDNKGRVVQEGRLGLSSILKSLGLSDPKPEQTKKYERTIATPTLGLSSVLRSLGLESPEPEQTNQYEGTVATPVLGLSSVLRTLGLETPKPEQTNQYEGTVAKPVLGLSSVLQTLGLEAPKPEQTNAYEGTVATPVLGMATLQKREAQAPTTIENTYNQLHVHDRVGGGGTQVEGSLNRAMDLTLKDPLEASTVARAAPVVNVKGPVLMNAELRDEAPNIEYFGSASLSHIPTTNNITNYEMSNSDEQSAVIGSRTGHVGNIHRTSGELRATLTRPESFSC